jgi:hypothetical protein
VYAAILDIRTNREKKEEEDRINRLKEEAAASPEQLRLIEVYEIELALVSKIADKVQDILNAEHSHDFYAGAFKKDTKPDPHVFAEALMADDCRPDLLDDKTLGMIRRLAEDPEFAFLLNHGVHKEAELRYELKGNPTESP